MKVVIEKIDNFTASKKYPPTNAQWQAIGMSGCDILVSAAAGSGKTEVLSDRISRKIAIDKWNIDEILVLTFTTAAAQNMLDRIEAKIEERLLVSGSYEDLFHLKQQRLKIGNAKISTIDSFCLEVLKKFYYLVEENIDGEIRYLSPNFKVLSNNSSLLNQSVSNVLENLAKDNNEFLDFLFSIYGKKTEILTMLTNLYKKILSIPNYREYLQKDFIKTNIFSNSDYISLERSIKHITKDNVYNELENITLFLSKFLEIITTEKSISEHITDLLISEHEEILNKINFDTDANEVENNFESSQFKKEYVESALLNIQNYTVSRDNNEIVELYEKISTLQNLISEYATLQMFNDNIAKLILEIDNKFIFEKRSRNFLDFSDLNHLAINALEKTVNSKKESTEASEYYKNLFLEIYVDEYQDNNDLQEYILNLIRGEGRYFFRVGDVKQAIYGFRGSNPNLFEEKYREYDKLSDFIDLESYNIDKDYTFETNSKGVCVVLKENFRSQENVLSTSNFIFNRLMHKNNAGISYDRDSSLYYPSVKVASNDDTPTYVLSPSESKVDSEVIIKNIIAEINNFMQDDTTLKYKDIAILSRNTNNMAKYKEIFEENNIKVYYKEKKGITDSHSFNILHNLLRFLDNQMLDASLLVLLRSAIFKFSNNELLLVSLEDGETFFDKLKNSKLEKSEHTINTINKWLNFCYNNSPYETLKNICWEINFAEYVRTMDKADAEIDYFENMLDIVRNSSAEDFNMLHTLETLQEIKDVGEYDTKRRVPDDSVTMSTIHISKGLEYKYVFVIDLDKKLNEKDYSSVITFSKELGVTLDFREIKGNTISNINKFYVANAELIKKKNLEEEIRNLYVALTRAEKGLYLVSSEKISIGSDTDNKLTKEQIIGSFSDVKNYADMLNLVFRSEVDTLDITEKDSKFAEYEIKLDIENIKLETEEISLDDNDENIEEQIANVEFLKQNNDVRVAYPSKTSYSMLKRMNNKKQVEKNNNNEFLVYDTIKKNSSLSNALLKGNTVHKLFERIVKDISIGISINNAENYVQSLYKTNDEFTNLKERRILSHEEYEIINNAQDYKLIVEFVNKITPLIINVDNIETEITFTTTGKVSELFDAENNKNEIIIQGVVDLMIKKDDSNFVIVDYKTDYVYGDLAKDTLIDRHKEQLDLYAEAIKKYYGKEITVQKYIYSYILGELIEV